DETPGREAPRPTVVRQGRSSIVWTSTIVWLPSTVGRAGPVTRTFFPSCAFKSTFLLSSRQTTFAPSVSWCVPCIVMPGDATSSLPVFVTTSDGADVDDVDATPGEVAGAAGVPFA